MIFQYSPLIYYILLVKDESSFYEIFGIAICINIKAFNRVKRKQQNILQTFLEHLKNHIVAYWRWFGTKITLTYNVPKVTCSYQLLIKTRKCAKLEKKKKKQKNSDFVRGDKLSTECWMCTIGGNALATNFGRWIWGDQISSPKATNVIAAEGTKIKW